MKVVVTCGNMPKLQRWGQDPKLEVTLGVEKGTTEFLR